MYLSCVAKQALDIETMLGQSWPAVYDVSSSLTQHWFNVSCFAGHVALFISDHDRIAQCRLQV